MRYLIFTYIKKPNGQMDESMEVSKRLRNRDIQMGSVILDFKDQRVLKSSVGEQMVPKDWDRIVSYYYQHYSATIERLFKENGYELVRPQETNSQ